MSSSWIEISRSALEHNLRLLRELAGSALVAPVVKANGYGHGMRLCAEVFVAAGVRILCVNELQEAADLADMEVDIYVLGPTEAGDADAVAELGCQVVSSSMPHVEAMAKAGRRVGAQVPVHLKIETGTNRQGVGPDEAQALIQHIRELEGVRLAGVATHLADVEDETEHTFAQVQLNRFSSACADLGQDVYRHCASSAAHLLFPAARLDMVRPGISCYGMWPSDETRIASTIVNGDGLQLQPVMRWKTRIAGIKEASRGEYVGYGRSLRLGRDSRIALLPVGYWDGYDRRLSGGGQALIRGARAPIAGRICMNMCMLDITGLPAARMGDEVTLLGSDGDAQITAEELARLAGTINYEITTRLHERLPRRLMP